MSADWRDGIEERLLREIDFACDYADNYNHGTPGHLSYLAIDKLVEKLDGAQEIIRSLVLTPVENVKQENP